MGTINDNTKEKTVKDVLNELTDEQKKVVYFLIYQALCSRGSLRGRPKKEKLERQTVKGVLNELTDEQKKVVYFLIGQALRSRGRPKKEKLERQDE